MVPCRPIPFLDSDYGKGLWRTPIHKGYKWGNLEREGKWSDAQWPHAIKYYSSSGFDKEKTLAYLNEYASKNVSITDVDDKEDEF
jgi:hypothetical protein